jgi:N-methylhydantoinase A/acetophenone carboxylase
VPGPAAFDRGGLEPTVTDSDVALGYIDPNYFLGGRFPLNQAKAVGAIRKRFADPLGLDVEEVCMRIKKRIDRNIADFVRKVAGKNGMQSTVGLTMLAYGGAGPTHCCGFAEELGINTIITFPFSPVFSAFGQSQMSVAHFYCHWGNPIQVNDQRISRVLGDMDKRLSTLVASGHRDMRGEGFSQEEVRLDLELLFNVDGRYIRAPHVGLSLDDPQTVLELAKGVESTFGVLPALVGILLRVTGPLPRFTFKIYPTDDNSAKALKGKRKVFWEEGGFQDTEIYDRSLLTPGSNVKGPCVVEALDTTYVIPTRWVASVDKYSHMILNRV